MSPYSTLKFIILFLACAEKFNPNTILASRVVAWNEINTLTRKTNTSTFSSLCQDQMVKVESNIYHLDRLRTSLKSAYFEKLFTSDDFKQKKNPVLEFQPLNSEVFPAVVDLIRGKNLSDVLNKNNYFPLLGAMNHLEMEIDLEKFSIFMKHNLTSYSLQEAKIFELYNFIRKNFRFEYLLKNVCERFSSDLTTLQNHPIFLFLPLDHLIQIINKVKDPKDKEIHEIIQMFTEWLCYDMENRLLYMSNLIISIKPAIHLSMEMKNELSKRLPKCYANRNTKRQIISRCIFALLANKNLDPKRLDELKPANNSKSFSPLDAHIFKLYSYVKKGNESKYLIEIVFKYFADNLATLRIHKVLPSLPNDHLIQIIKNVQEPNDEKRYEIIQMCTEWLCYDMKNRFPHLMNLVISAKSLLHSSIEENSDVRKCLPKCHVDEQAKRNIISNFLFAMLMNDEMRSLKKILADDESNSKSDDGKSPYSSEYNTRFVNRNHECDKLKKFLNNTAFYDITVRVGEKTHKLHRFFLESKSGYFKNIFQTEYAEAVAQRQGTPTCPSKNKEYLLDDAIEPSIFDDVIHYIYFGNYDQYRWNQIDNIVGVFKTIDTLDIIDGEILENCKRKLVDDHDQVNSQDVVQILNYTHGKTKHEDLYLLYLCKHMTAEWPKIYNLSHFCSISWTMMENILKSPHFDLDSLDPDKILDIYSKWLSHDLKNRFKFLPRIAQIINPLCVPDHDKYTVEEATKLNNCSQEFVRDKLWESLSSLSCTIPSKNLLNKTSRKLEEIPVFVAARNEETIDILNANFDEIASLHCPGSHITSREQSVLSAAIIHDNLFILVGDFWETGFFYVYNLFSKKRLSLPLDSRLKCSPYWLGPETPTLLNCNNEIYFCSWKGLIMKYSMQMNRWKMISKQNDSNILLRFAGDGKTLYRIIYKVCSRELGSHYIAEAYDFEKKLWNPVQDLPVIQGIINVQFRLTVVNDNDLAVSSLFSVFMSDRNSSKWKTIKIPSEIYSFDLSIFTQYEDRMLLVVPNGLYQLSPSKTNANWEFKKKLPLKNNCSETKFENLRYQIIAAVHRPRLCIN